MGNNIWKIWKTTRKQQGNEWKTCGDNWKSNSGKQIGIVKGFNMRAILRPHLGRHHQPDWETNESLYGETNELETAEEPDTTSQTGRQMNRYMGRQMNWRQPKSRTPPARLGDKWIVIWGDKWIGDSRRAGHHQPDWETNESLYGDTNELETAEEPDTTSQTGRQMNRYMGRQMNWKQPKSRTPPARLEDKWIVIWGDKWIGESRRAGHHQPDWETNESLYGETNELERAEELDTTSQTGRQMNRYMGTQMNWRQPKSRTPPARLGDKWIVIWGDKWIGDSRRAGHHQPDWETNESLYGETNELETAEEPDTTSQTGRQMNRYMGRQMTWKQPKSRTPPARLGDKWIVIWGDKWIGDSRRAGHHQPDWETNESLHGETNELETSGEPDTTIWTKPDTYLRKN